MNQLLLQNILPEHVVRHYIDYGTQTQVGEERRGEEGVEEGEERGEERRVVFANVIEPQRVLAQRGTTRSARKVVKDLTTS